jgi:hypothetical protein
MAMSLSRPLRSNGSKPTDNLTLPTERIFFPDPYRVPEVAAHGVFPLRSGKV